MEIREPGGIPVRMLSSSKVGLNKVGISAGWEGFSGQGFRA